MIAGRRHERHKPADLYFNSLLEATTVPPGVFPGGLAGTGTWDQSGNVAEWCSDEVVGALPGGDRDPHRPAAGGGTRALRGGSFVLDSQILRVSYRNDFVPHWRGAFIGFRCVLPEVP
ncbi:MAG: SUMF1/EgtB/PvdO family nonheme iron enzyme [Myxococcales bacterium]|nr:SUMF1/EgtB/PvdO family nonheme iron enzyme [Myxococcales bacterium]